MTNDQRAIRIAHIGVVSQVMLNLLHDAKADGLFARQLKARTNLFVSELLHTEKQTFDDWLNSEAESQAEVIYDVYNDFLKIVAKVEIQDMVNVGRLIEAYKKDPKSINGLCKKILK
jgi:hypothetical protein